MNGVIRNALLAAALGTALAAQAPAPLSSESCLEMARCFGSQHSMVARGRRGGPNRIAATILDGWVDAQRVHIEPLPR